MPATDEERTRIERDAEFRATVLGSLDRIEKTQNDHEGRLRKLELRVYGVVLALMVAWGAVQFAAKYVPGLVG